MILCPPLSYLICSTQRPRSAETNAGCGDIPCLVGIPGEETLTAPESVWGHEHGRLGQYALVSAETLVRLLLPARLPGDDQPTTWRQVAADYRATDALDGYTSWFRLTELPADGGWEPPVRYEAPSGRMSEDMLRTLRRILLEVGGHHVTWRSESPIAHLARHEGSLGSISAAWTTSGFPGRAWTSDLRIGLAAPPYADSVIISGPAELQHRLITSGLEAFPVSRREPDPITTE